MNTPNKKERLIESAAILFHRNGLMATSLADIAKHADIPIGNVYYYFKTKDDLAVAAITKRREQFAASYTLLSETMADPRERLIEAIEHYNKIRDDYAKYGCPIGKIVNDTDAEKDHIAQIATAVLADFVAWAKLQFIELGHDDDSESYAISLMAGIQGAVVMAKAFHSEKILQNEYRRLTQWIESLPNKRIPLGKIGFRTSA